MWKRLTLSLVAVAALSALVMGASFALFTANTSNSSNTFTAGTVNLTGTFSTTISATGMVPGDSREKSYTITYDGNVPAWVALDTTFGGDLTTCDSGNSLKATVDNGFASGASGYVSYSNNAPNQLLNGTIPTATGTSYTFHVLVNLPGAAGNTCQGKSATLTIGVHAVQAGNNPLATSGTTPGQPSWS